MKSSNKNSIFVTYIPDKNFFDILSKLFFNTIQVKLDELKNLKIYYLK